MLGRHVEGLEFFEVLLGDEPALTPQQRFYQRALTGDAAEATYHAELCLKDQSLENYLHTVALSGLKLAERDASRGTLDDEQEERIDDTVKEMLDNLADFEPRRWFSKLQAKARGPKGTSRTGIAALDAAENGEDDRRSFPVVERSELAPGWVVDEPVLCIGGRNALDAAAADMLADVLRKRGLGVKELGPEVISAGHISSLASTEAKLVCLSYLGLGNGPAHIRYLVRRLRRTLPKGTLILVCYWTDEAEAGEARELLQHAEADSYATVAARSGRTLHESCQGRTEGRCGD